MEHRLFTVCFTLFLLSSGVVSGTEVVNGTIGKYIYLNQSISNPALLLQWYFKDNQTATRYPSLAPECNPSYAGRCQMYEDGTLRLDNLNSSDDGTYRFTALQPPYTMVKEAFYELRVYHPVSDVNVTSNVSGLVWPGLDSVSLICSAQGTNVTYFWSLQGAPLPKDPQYHLTENNRVLTINPVSDNGAFTCTAANSINSQNSNGVVFNLASPSSCHGLSGGEVAGIVIGVVAGIAIIEVIVFFVLKTKKKPPLGTIYDNSNVPPPHIYSTIIPGTELKPTQQESDYEQLTQQYSAIYNILEPSTGK
ncbi:cell adhesion molecule CEACAM7-like [Aquarana catesbeiana]|uniref:cell adhesion molecule CEACAM7-like n=1 Tax=Aquarana catesbeiana TaxID=8400 RepID=UPI003CC9BCB1